MITLLAMFLACSSEVAQETTTTDAQVETTGQAQKADADVATPSATQVNAQKTSETLDEMKKDLDDTIKTLDEVKVLVKDLDKKTTDDNNDNDTTTNDKQIDGDDNANND